VELAIQKKREGYSGKDLQKKSFKLGLNQLSSLPKSVPGSRLRALYKFLLYCYGHDVGFLWIRCLSCHLTDSANHAFVSPHHSFIQ